MINQISDKPLKLLVYLRVPSAEHVSRHVGAINTDLIAYSFLKGVVWPAGAVANNLTHRSMGSAHCPDNLI